MQLEKASISHALTSTVNTLNYCHYHGRDSILVIHPRNYGTSQQLQLCEMTIIFESYVYHQDYSNRYFFCRSANLSPWSRLNPDAELKIHDPLATTAPPVSLLPSPCA